MKNLNSFDTIYKSVFITEQDITASTIGHVPATDDLVVDTSRTLFHHATNHDVDELLIGVKREFAYLTYGTGIYLAEMASENKGWGNNKYYVRIKPGARILNGNYRATREEAMEIFDESTGKFKEWITTHLQRYSYPRGVKIKNLLREANDAKVPLADGVNWDGVCDFGLETVVFNDSVLSAPVLITTEQFKKALAGAALGASLLGGPSPDADAAMVGAHHVASQQASQSSVYDQIVSDLKRHEGSILYQRAKRFYRGGKFYPYQDSKDIWTIGYGHKILDGEDFSNGISNDHAEQILRSDIRDAWNAAHRLMAANGVRPNPILQRVLVNMCFQMGATGVSKFENMWEHLSNSNYSEAADEMLDSKWAKVDSPRRALELSKIVRNM